LEKVVIDLNKIGALGLEWGSMCEVLQDNISLTEMNVTQKIAKETQLLRQ
jgi:hypothetical protein